MLKQEHPHQIPFEEKKYLPPRVEADPVIPIPQPVHKYLTRYLKCLNEVYNNLLEELIATHAQRK